MRAVDLDLFVKSASAGWNDGAKVPGPFAAFLGGLSDGINEYYANEQKAAQTEQIRLANEMAPYEKIIQENKAAKAEIETQAIRENPDAFKDSIVKKAETERLQKEQAAAYEAKKVKLVDLANAQDFQAMGDAYNDPQFQDVFSKDQALNKQYKGTYTEWSPESKATYTGKQRELMQAQTNESLYGDAVALFEKNKPDYVANPDINNLKEIIKDATGKPVSDTDLWDNGIILPVKGPKRVPQKIDEVDAKGNPVLGADGITPNKVFAPPDKFGQIPYVVNPFAKDGDEETRNVLMYNGKPYELGNGISSKTSDLFGSITS